MEYGLIGEKLGHSYSKEIHAEIGDYNYELKEIPRDELESFIKSRDFRGINVTIPYKQAVIPLLDYVDPAALKIGAVNTVVNREGKLYGYNTDFIGLQKLILSAKINPKGKKTLILGTGGTSKTAFAAAESLGASPIIFVSRSAESAENKPSLEKPADSSTSAEIVNYEQAAELHSDAALIINTTPCGMYPKTEGCPINLEPFEKLEGVIDVIYNPLRTNLVLQAQKKVSAGGNGLNGGHLSGSHGNRGRRNAVSAKGGLYMLVQQAVSASEFFFDKKINPKISERIFKKIQGQKQNIVLIGMPGSGKTTVGKVLSRVLGKDFLDTDKIIEEKYGSAPSEIIREKGEQAFRDIESQVCLELQNKTGAVIATGGGAILREENVSALKKNGVLIFLDRKFENIRPTRDRPLSDSKDKLAEVFKTRYPIYCGAADIHIRSSENVRRTVDGILRALDLQ